MFWEILPLLALLTFVPSSHQARVVTKGTTTTEATYEPLAPLAEGGSASGRCVGSMCPVTPRPCTGFGCPTTPRPCTGFGCPVTTPMPIGSGVINKAIVALNTGNEGSGVRGYLELNQQYSYTPVSINGTIFGLLPSKRVGIHIHEAGDIREGCTSSKLHFNPNRQQHGSPTDTSRHAGDLGNIQADSNGKVTINMNNNAISLSGTNSIIGRMLVIHEREDDLGRGGYPESKVNGNSGMIMACGIVGIAAVAY